MTITIKYFLEGTEKAYNTFEEIQQLEDYNDIVYMCCYDNKLTELPSILPDSLQILDCSDNNLTELPPTLPDSLQELDCCHNKLTDLPQTLPDSLQELYCYHNKLTDLPPTLPPSLQKLRCHYNNLTDLPPTLPDSLQILWCHYNNLTELPSTLPDSLQRLYCSSNKLTELPPTLPDSLQRLYCSSNKLTELPPTLPDSLQRLYCSYNNLTELPTLPNSLQELYCHDNKLTELPTLPNSLQELYCSYNNLTELPTLPDSLQILYCSYNKLTDLPQTLPDSLQRLWCHYNNLTELPSTLPDSLQKLLCSNNKLTALPTNLHEYRNLTSFVYGGNEIEYIPPHITRFLNRLSGQSSNGTTKLYGDGQNVHNHQIQASIRNSIYAVMKTKPSITTDEMISELVASVVLTEKTKRLLMEYCGDDSIHSVIGITFKELLLAVWSIIRDHKDINEILAIMNTEMDDADCKCFTGKMSRLINCLNGYDSRVSITMADNDQIGNIIIIEKEKLEINGHYKVEIHRNNVLLAMKERGYTQETIEKWIGYIE